MLHCVACSPRALVARPAGPAIGDNPHKAKGSERFHLSTPKQQCHWTRKHCHFARLKHFACRMQSVVCLQLSHKCSCACLLVPLQLGSCCPRFVRLHPLGTRQTAYNLKRMSEKVPCMPTYNCTHHRCCVDSCDDPDTLLYRGNPSMHCSQPALSRS